MPTLELTVATLAVALGSGAGAAGWRDLRIDARSEARYSESVARLQQELTPSRRLAFALSWRDVWNEGAQRAAAEGREYTSADYLRQLDGLGYDEIVRLTDPSGVQEERYRRDYRDSRDPPVNDAYGEAVRRALRYGERIPL
jgi:hypothetical protein